MGHNHQVISENSRLSEKVNNRVNLIRGATCLTDKSTYDGKNNLKIKNNTHL